MAAVDEEAFVDELGLAARGGASGLGARDERNAQAVLLAQDERRVRAELVGWERRGCAEGACAGAKRGRVEAERLRL